jgi:hypothetical protein
MLPDRRVSEESGLRKKLMPEERLAPHQLVGEVTAHQGNDG